MAQADSLAHVLSDHEKDKITAFLGDDVMKEAVRKVLLAGIYYNGIVEAGMPVNPAVNFLLQYPFAVDMQHAPVTDAEIGADVRAEVKAIRKVEQAWQALIDYAAKPKTPKKGPRSNRAY